MDSVYSDKYRMIIWSFAWLTSAAPANFYWSSSIRSFQSLSRLSFQWAYLPATEIRCCPAIHARSCTLRASRGFWASFITTLSLIRLLSLVRWDYFWLELPSEDLFRLPGIKAFSWAYDFHFSFSQVPLCIFKFNFRALHICDRILSWESAIIQTVASC